MKFQKPPELIPGQRCGAKLRNKPGKFCQQYPIKGRKRCRLHGGLTPRGEKSVHYTRGGIYSAYLPASIIDKVESLKDHNPLDLFPELHILRGLLATYLDSLKNRENQEITYASEITVISELIGKISILVDKIVKIRNDTALTASELKLIGLRMAEVTSKYIPDENERNNFLKEIFTTAIPITDESQYPYLESGNNEE